MQPKVKKTLGVIFVILLPLSFLFITPALRFVLAQEGSSQSIVGVMNVIFTILFIVGIIFLFSGKKK